MTTLSFFDSRSQTQREFAAIDGPKVGMYTCGPTVYARAHLGNLRAYVFADMVRRTLSAFGYRVKQVMNVTDVGHLTDDADAGDDKVERAARAERTSAWEITRHFEALFFQDLAKLSVLPPSVVCRATEHIDEQIAMIAALVERGLTYETPDGLYFDVARDLGYGRLTPGLSGLEQSEARVVGAEHKRQSADFALWKRSPRDARRQMEWDSPWGRGFPGWHIECSAMAHRYLGRQLDLHTGGVDHIPVHHENELAQSENALGVSPWVGTWLHGEWLVMQQQKLSKSSGGAPNLDDVLARGLTPAAFRWFLLGAHYRQKLTFRWDAVEAAEQSVTRLRRIAQAPADTHLDMRSWRERLLAALGDDLATPRALALVWDAARSSELKDAERSRVVQELTSVLGVSLAAATESDFNEAERTQIEQLLERREAARVARDFAQADALRAELAQLGVVVEDAPDGPRYRRDRSAGPTGVLT